MKAVKKFAGNFLRDYYWRKHRILFMPYGNDESVEKFATLFDKVSGEVELLQARSEAFLLYSCALKTNKLEGDIAEVGVYQGGSARLICEVKGKRRLYLFDTWEGLPYDDEFDAHMKKGLYKAEYEAAKNYLKKFNGVSFHRGVFPGTSGVVKNKKFSLVSLDLDLYKATKESLEFFYPRMVKGGVIISHNYKDLSGVKKAFDSFFGNKPELVLGLNNSQVLVQKTG